MRKGGDKSSLDMPPPGTCQHLGDTPVSPHLGDTPTPLGDTPAGFRVSPKVQRPETELRDKPHDIKPI